MKGELVFEALGQVNPRFIAEADPFFAANSPLSTTDAPAKSSRARRPLGGWVAAAVCVIVALGVYAGTMWFGRGQTEIPGGTEQKTEGTPATETFAEETIPEPPVDDGLVELSPVFANPWYVVEKRVSRYFLNFYKGNYVYGGMIEPCVSFESVEDMVLSLYYGDLDEEQMRCLSTLPVTTLGYEIFDISDVVVPVLPEGATIREVQLYGKEYTIFYSIPSIEGQMMMAMSRGQREPGWAARTVESQGEDADSRTETIIDGLSAVILEEHSSNSRWKTVHISCVDEATGTEIYGCVEYLLETSAEQLEYGVSDTIPWRINIRGNREGWDYHVTMSAGSTVAGDSFEITKDFLLSFLVEPYETPRVQPSISMEIQPHEVIQDGEAFYVTFPGWDGTLLDISLSDIEEKPALPTFASVEELRDFLLGGEMSFYQQILFKMNADEQGRVRVPDPRDLLDYGFPKCNVSDPNIVIDPDGYYHGKRAFTTDSGYYEKSFSVVSEQRWNDEKSSIFPVAEQNGVTSVRVEEGWYCGLPCTFYEYVKENYGNPRTYVLFHIHSSEEMGGMEYFMTCRVELDWLLWEDRNVDEEELYGFDVYAMQDIYAFGVTQGQYHISTLYALEEAYLHILKQITVVPLSE